MSVLKKLWVLLFPASVVLFASTGCDKLPFFGKKKQKDSLALAADSLGLTDSLKNTEDAKLPKNLEFSGPMHVYNSYLILGGTTELGAPDEDLYFDLGNNVPRKLEVKTFYMDETELGNIHWLEYLFYVQRDSSRDFYLSALPDTTVWARDMGFNDFYVENYLRYPAFRYYPVVGVSWIQANDYCLWRTAIVASKIELDSTQAKPGFFDRLFKKEEKPSMAPVYRLPTEEEWEYAAIAFMDNQVKDPNVTHKRIYPWDGHTLRNSTKKSQGMFLANFKRGFGDYGGIADRGNDDAHITTYIYQYPPNDFGLYNMAGNVNEWVEDSYEPIPFFGKEAEQDNSGDGFLDDERYNKAGFSLLTNNKMKVYKGGSWSDVAYWLSPGTRRYLAQDSSTATIGIRCAFDAKSKNQSDSTTAQTGEEEATPAGK